MSIEKAARRIAMQEKVKFIQGDIESRIQAHRNNAYPEDVYLSVVTSKYQVTIPQSIRNELKLEPKECVFFMPIETGFYDVNVFMMYKEDGNENYAVSTKGQITLKKEFREKFELKAGHELLFFTEQGVHFMVITKANDNPYVNIELLAHLKNVYDEADFYKKPTISVFDKSSGITDEVLFQYVNVYEENDLMYVFSSNKLERMEIEESESVSCKWFIMQNPVTIYQEAFGYETWDLNKLLTGTNFNVEQFRKQRNIEWKKLVKFLKEHPNIKFLAMQEPELHMHLKNNRLSTDYGKVLELFIEELKKEGIYIHLFISPRADSVLMLERSIATHYGEVIRVNLKKTVTGGVDEISKITYNEYKGCYDFNTYYRGL